MAMDSPSFSVALGLINANWHCGASPLYFEDILEDFSVSLFWIYIWACLL